MWFGHLVRTNPWGAPSGGTTDWEETPGQIQVMLQRRHLPAGLQKPGDSSGGAGGIYKGKIEEIMYKKMSLLC